MEKIESLSEDILLITDRTSDPGFPPIICSWKFVGIPHIRNWYKDCYIIAGRMTVPLGDTVVEVSSERIKLVSLDTNYFYRFKIVPAKNVPREVAGISVPLEYDRFYHQICELRYDDKNIYLTLNEKTTKIPIVKIRNTNSFIYVEDKESREWIFYATGRVFFYG